MTAEYSMFKPESAGDGELLSKLTSLSIKQLVPFLASLCDSLQLRQMLVILLEDYPSQDSEFAVEELKILFNKWGSDKAWNHNYHCFYGSVLKNKDSIDRILEIGLGTNNEDVASHMGPNGSPGASLRAFRDYLPRAHIYGADFDRRILFTEARINTFFVDQTEPRTFDDLSRELKVNQFDLIIDDGLHAPNANLATLKFALDMIKVGGWFVVEDIDAPKFDLWRVVTALIPERFDVVFLKGRNANMFAVNRLS